MYRTQQPSSPLLIITFGGNVMAVERRTGRLVWRWRYEEQYAARLLFPTGRVLLAYARELVCLAYTTGALMWRTAVPVFAGSILVEEDEIFYGAAGEVGCVDANTGQILWHHDFPGMGQHHVALGVPGNVAQIDWS